jgi:hypothetical protein
MKANVDLEALPSLDEGELAGIHGGLVITGALAAQLKAKRGTFADILRHLPLLRAPWTPIPPVTSLIA